MIEQSKRQQNKRQYPHTTFKPQQRTSDSRLHQVRQNGEFFCQGVSSPSSGNHRKTPSMLAPLKMDDRNYQHLDVIKINHHAHTPTEKVSSFSYLNQDNINSNPVSDDSKFFKAHPGSLRKIQSEIKKNDNTRDGYGRLLQNYFPQISDQLYNPSTASSDTFQFNLVDKQKSPTAQRTQKGQQSSQYFSPEYLNQSSPKQIKIQIPKEGSFSQEFMLKNFGNGSPIKMTMNTCSTVETLQYRRSQENFQKPSPIFKSIQQQQQAASNKLKIGDFILIKQLGIGKYGSVYLVRHRIIGFTAAIKVIKKKVIIEGKLLKQLIRELKIQAYLNHPNIISMYGCFDDKENVYILLELASEGQLYSKLKQKQRYTEETASFIIKNLLSSVQYMHSKKLLHRDIKPENIVVVHGIVKLCDFGWAVYRGNDLRSTFCGTPLYLSPELLLGRSYDEKADLWSVGILSYELVVGRMPFEITEERQLTKIITDQVEFPTDLNLSEEFKDFVLRILNRDPKVRLCSDELLKHKFIEKYSEFETCQELCVG